MSTVKRFEFDRYDGASEANDGDFVTYEAYQALFTLLERANECIRSRVDHDWSCPRSRDDFECNCGLSDLKHDMQEAL